MVKRGIILADLQFPNCNPVLLLNVERYMKAHRWDYVVILGDFMDMDAISHHAYEHNDRRSLEGKRLKKDYLQANKILDRWQKLAKKADFTFFIGNHEEWSDKLYDQIPGIEGLIDPTNMLHLHERGMRVIPARHAHKIGKIVFAHGDVANGAMGYSTVYHSKKMVELYNRNVVYGDKHTFQAFTKISPAGINETHTGYCIPAMADTNPIWAKDRPNAWINGFGVFYMDEHGFTVCPVIAVKGSFISPEGQRYG